jgi:hypothetical protein
LIEGITNARLTMSVMHLKRLGKADRLVRQALDPGPQCQVLAFNLLRVTLAGLVLI